MRETHLYVQYHGLDVRFRIYFEIELFFENCIGKSADGVGRTVQVDVGLLGISLSFQEAVANQLHGLQISGNVKRLYGKYIQDHYILLYETKTVLLID